MKKILILFVILICLFGVSSCEKEMAYDDMDKVTYETLLNLPGSYIVVAYQANCPNCEKLKSVISDYIDYAEENKSAMPIYAINVNLAINKKMLLKQDESYPSNMVGSTNYKDIKVKATPAIMVVKNKKLTKIISDYNTTTPVTDGKTYFQDLMK